MRLWSIPPVFTTYSPPDRTWAPAFSPPFLRTDPKSLKTTPGFTSICFVSRLPEYFILPLLLLTPDLTYLWLALMLFTYDSSPVTSLRPYELTSSALTLLESISWAKTSTRLVSLLIRSWMPTKFCSLRILARDRVKIESFGAAYFFLPFLSFGFLVGTVEYSMNW